MEQFRVKEVKAEYDRTNPLQVYEMMATLFPYTSAKSWTPEMILPFIPAGADPVQWSKTLRNVEYNATKPQTKKRKRRRASTSNSRSNPAEIVTRRTTTDSLFRDDFYK